MAFSPQTTGFPGITGSYGSPQPPGIASGLATYWGGGAVLFVGNRSGLPAGDGLYPSRPMSSVLGALKKLNATTSRGHVIFVLPGHAESITVADWATTSTGAADTVAIVGLGTGAARGAFTWTTAVSTWLFNTNNFVLDNLNLGLEPTTGTITVAAPITVSTPGCAIRNCRILTGTDANNKVTIAITTTSAADDFVFENNRVYGAALATMTTFIRCVGLKRPLIRGNYINCGTTSAAVGPIQELTTACTDIWIDSNWIQNNAAASSACITMGLAATTGWISRNILRNMGGTGINTQIVVTSGDVSLFDNKGVNTANTTAILLGTASS